MLLARIVLEFLKEEQNSSLEPSLEWIVSSSYLTFLLLLREQNLHGSALDHFLLVSPCSLAHLISAFSLSWAISPTLTTGRRMRDCKKSTNPSLSSSEGERGGRAGGSNLRKCDKAAGVPWSQAAIRGGLASKEQAATLSYWPGVPKKAWPLHVVMDFGVQQLSCGQLSSLKLEVRGPCSQLPRWEPSHFIPLWPAYIHPSSLSFLRKAVSTLELTMFPWFLFP